MRALAMLKRRHIAILWSGLVMSCVGDYFNMVAVMWVAARLVGSGAGVVAACQSGAALAFAPIGGLLADRVDRRRAMITADVVRAVALGSLAFYVVRGGLGLVPLVAVAVVLGTFDALFTPSLHASVPQLVEHPGELQATNGLMDATRRIARIVAPSLAGGVAALVSIGHFFTLDAISFLASALAIFSLGGGFAWRAQAAPPSVRAPATGIAGAWRRVAEGGRVVLKNSPVTWALSTVFAVNATWCAGFQVGGALFTSRVLHTDIGGYGLLIGAYGVGNIAGNVVVSNLVTKRKLLAIFGSRLLLGTGFLLMAAAPNLHIAMVAAAIAAVGGPIGEIPMVGMLQMEFPAHQTGRVFGVYVMVQHAGVALGLVLAAPLFAFVSERLGIALCAVLLAASGVAGLLKFGVRR
jgi:MFS family permease